MLAAFLIATCWRETSRVTCHHLLQTPLGISELLYDVFVCFVFGQRDAQSVSTFILTSGYMDVIFPSMRCAKWDHLTLCGACLAKMMEADKRNRDETNSTVFARDVTGTPSLLRDQENTRQTTQNDSKHVQLVSLSLMAFENC